MATRLYLQNAAPGASPSTNRGAWDDVASKIFRGLSRTKSGSITSLGVANATTTDAWDVMILKLVSEPIPAQTIAGTLNVCIGAAESNGAMNGYWHVHAYVTQGDTDALRGTLLTDWAENTTNEWPAPNATGLALQAAQNLSSVAISENDRIVIEIGYVKRNTSATSRTGTLFYGGTGSDLTVSGDETTLTGWVEFSGNLFSVIHEGVAVLAGAATLAAAGSFLWTGAVALAAAATIAASPTVERMGAAALSSSATFAATASVEYPGASALVGTATLAGAGTIEFGGVLAATGTATLEAVGTVERCGAATLSAVATLDASGTVESAGGTTHEGVAVLAGVGSFVATGSVERCAVANLTATASVTASGSAVLQASAMLGCAATVAAIASVAPPDIIKTTPTRRLMTVPWARSLFGTPDMPARTRLRRPREDIDLI